MAARNASEMLAGAVVLAVALGFLGYAVANTGRSSGGGNTLHAMFDRIDGLSNGSDVRLAGVKVGSVLNAVIDPKTFQARVDFSLSPAVHLPRDSSAEVTSDGLLGGKYLSLVPGGDEATIPNGGTVTITQSSVSLEQLLGKFIFSVGDLAGSAQKQGAKSPAASPPGPAGQATKPGLVPPLQ